MKSNTYLKVMMVWKAMLRHKYRLLPVMTLNPKSPETARAAIKTSATTQSPQPNPWFMLTVVLRNFVARDTSGPAN